MSNWQARRKAPGEAATPRRKYGNKKTLFDEKVFDSQHEAHTWAILLQLQKAGRIKELQRQVSFKLGVEDADGAPYHLCTYRADFTFIEQQKNGEWLFIVADAKGMQTPEYKLKKKLMKALRGYEIREY